MRAIALALWVMWIAGVLIIGWVAFALGRFLRNMRRRRQQGVSQTE